MQNKKHYYLINETVKVSDSKMPEKETVENRIKYAGWYINLQPCEIDESELEKVIKYLNNHFGVVYGGETNNNPIDITDIIFEKDGKAYFKRMPYAAPFINNAMFKQPAEKQVESDAVEFAEWIHSEKWVYNKGLYYKGISQQTIVSTKQLYEIFKNR